jgi:hypothetical protein
MHGPKTDSFAYHTSSAEGNHHKAKHHVGAGALKHKKTRKHNPSTKVSENTEEKTWQPVDAVQVAESKPFNSTKLVQKNNNDLKSQPKKVEAKKVEPVKKPE